MNTLQLQSRRWTRQARKAGLIHNESLRYTAQEQENMKLQAAWLMRCYKPLAKFHVQEEPNRIVFVAPNRFILEVPYRLRFGLTEFVSFAISDVRYHGSCSEQHQNAAATLRVLLGGKGGKRTIGIR